MREEIIQLPKPVAKLHWGPTLMVEEIWPEIAIVYPVIYLPGKQSLPFFKATGVLVFRLSS